MASCPLFHFMLSSSFFPSYLLRYHLMCRGIHGEFATWGTDRHDSGMALLNSVSRTGASFAGSVRFYLYFFLLYFYILSN